MVIRSRVGVVFVAPTCSFNTEEIATDTTHRCHGVALRALGLQRGKHGSWREKGKVIAGAGAHDAGDTDCLRSNPQTS